MKAQNETSRTKPGDGNYVIGPYNVSEQKLQAFSNKYNFNQFPIIWDGTVIAHKYPDGPTFYMNDIVTQTLREPTAATTGMDYAYDETENDGWELRTHLNGSVGVEGLTKFTVGNAPFYLKWRFSIDDVSGTDDCAIGFCKDEAHDAAIDNKDEMACLNVISGNITIETILNGGATTTTDTTDNWADGESHTLEVYVSKVGVVTYKIDGAAPTTTAAFSFDTNEVVTPFFYFLQAADPEVAALILQEFECGLQ